MNDVALLAKTFGIKFDVKKKLNALEAELAETYKKYPLLPHLDANVPSEKLAQYINLIDKE